MSTSTEAVWDLLEQLTDPEIPVISLREMGILRAINLQDDGLMEVVITPTYSGCPAMSQIEEDIVQILADNHIPAKVTVQLSPAWSTDWMDEVGKEKLRGYGIAPPHVRREQDQTIGFMPKGALAAQQDVIPCPQCGSENTVVTSYFGSTACKALYKCLDCREPFDYFKPY